MFIATVKHLAYILRCKASENEILSICSCLADQERKSDSTFYREIILESEKKGKIKIRKIHPSQGRLKLIQEKIKKQILDQITFPPYVQGAHKGYSNISNARMHQGKKYKFTTDIKKFFPSITSKRVYTAFSNYGFNPEISRVLTLLTTYKGKVPQGAATSSHIANMVFKPIDEWIYEFTKPNNIIYSRYIDDLTLSSQQDFKDILPDIIQEITNFGFTISAPKTHYRHILDITGITVENNKIKPDKKFYDKLEDKDQSEASKQGRLKYLERVLNS